MKKIIIIINKNHLFSMGTTFPLGYSSSQRNTENNPVIARYGIAATVRWWSDGFTVCFLPTKHYISYLPTHIF